MIRSITERVEADAVETLVTILREHPEIRERTAQFLAADPSRDELKALQPGLHESTLRKRRLRERRKQAGMKAYEVWLDATGQALIDELRRPGESLDTLVRRALATLNAEQERATSPVPSPDEPSHPPAMADTSYAQHKAVLIQRIRTMQAEGLSLQAIASRFTAEGIPTLSGRGTWKKGTISNLLRE